MVMAKRFCLGFCEMGVYSQTTGQETDCGDPAIAIWSWGEGEPLKACERHDKIITQIEEEIEYAD